METYSKTKSNYSLKKIHISDFPKNIFIKLPEDYRNILFQLILLEFGNAKNLIGFLKNKNLSENIFRWRRGSDRGLFQFINLESLLHLLDKAKKRRDSIETNLVFISKIPIHDDRIQKNKEILSLISDLRYIQRGYFNLSKKVGTNQNTLKHYVLNERIKTLPNYLIQKILQYATDDIICHTLTIEELENKIISYRAYHGKEIISNFKGERKLPIKVTPEFESIIYHLLGDGHVRTIGSGEYTQLPIEGKTNFLNKLYSSFGYFEITKKSFDDGKVIIPKVIISILCKHYKMDYNGFNWNVSQLPSNITNDNDFKIAGLSAFIVDEGNISNRGIELYSSNNLLLSQIRKLATNLRLSCSPIKTKKPNGTTKESFRFRIRKESSVKLSFMIDTLKEKYPNCGLAQKENKLGIVSKSS